MKTNRLKELYDLLPEIDCKGDCWTYCGAVPTGEVEEEHIKDELSEKSIPIPGGDMYCNQLDRETGRCTIHPRRPLLCRLFGLVKNPKMKCPHGCEPEYWVPESVARKLIGKIVNGEQITIEDEELGKMGSPFRQALIETGDN